MKQVLNKANNLTSENVKEILSMYPNTPTAYIAKKFDKSITTIYKTASRYGVQKSEDFKKSEFSGRIKKGQMLSESTQFKKGFVPFTKGKKLKDICKSEDSYRRSIANRWYKGCSPINEKKDGDITIRRIRSVGNGNVIPYKFIRISRNKWEFLHRHIWSLKNGKIPDGFNIVFKDGNTMNCSIDNLECISNAELVVRNSLHNLPEEIREVIYLKTSLTKAINNASKKERNECY